MKFQFMLNFLVDITRLQVLQCFPQDKFLAGVSLK